MRELVLQRKEQNQQRQRTFHISSLPFDLKVFHLSLFISIHDAVYTTKLMSHMRRIFLTLRECLSTSVVWTPGRYLIYSDVSNPSKSLVYQ